MQYMQGGRTLPDLEANLPLRDRGILHRSKVCSPGNEEMSLIRDMLPR